MTSSTNHPKLYIACSAVALLALVATWGHNVSYLPLGFLQANQTFWQDTLVNPASRSITGDLLALCIPVFYWMFAEARRLSMRGIWLYVAASLLVAISVAVPVFIMHRAHAEKQGQTSATVGTLRLGDWIGMALLSAIAVAYVVVSFCSLHAS